MSEPRSKPQRTCLGCRQVAVQEDLVRFVLAPDGDLLVDYRQRLPGRGAYTHLDKECILTAVKRQQFERTFRGPHRKVAGEELLSRLAEGVRERIFNLLGMARKSRQVVSGSNMVLDGMESGGLALVFLAEDISSGIEEKVVARASRNGVLWYRLFDKGLLGQVLGKGERSVVALKAGPLAEAIRKELFRYKHIVGES